MSDDKVNNPRHYTNGELQCIQAIEAALTPEEFRGYCKGNVIKYTWREKYKGGTQDLKKATWYLQRLVDYGKKAISAVTRTELNEPYNPVNEIYRGGKK